jgi:dihydrofolate reductase
MTSDTSRDAVGTNKVIVWMQSSLDGRTNGPDGEFDWPLIGDELHTHFVSTLAGAGAFCYGRRVFEMMASFWPIADELPDSTANQAAYARIWRPMPKLVMSRTLEDPGWNSTVVGDLDRIPEVVRSAAGDVYVFGGAETVASFAEHDLVDEYRVFVHPVVLGGGPRLFAPGPERRPMTLRGTQTFDDRVVELHYARSRD